MSDIDNIIAEAEARQEGIQQRIDDLEEQLTYLRLELAGAEGEARGLALARQVISAADFQPVSEERGNRHAVQRVVMAALDDSERRLGSRRALRAARETGD